MIAALVLFSITALQAFGNFPENDSYTFFTAAENGDYAKLHELISGGIDVNTKDELGGTALLYAAGYGHIQCAELLIISGANVNEVHPKGGGTPLQAAAWEGQPEEVELLLKYGANINAIDKDGRTALHAAVSKRNRYVVKILLDNGAYVSIKNKKGETALDWAKQSGFVEIIELLESVV